MLLSLYPSALYGVIFSLQLMLWPFWQRGHGHPLNWVHRSARTGRHRDAHPGMRGLRTHDGAFLRLVLRRGPGANRAMGRRADDPTVLDMRQHVREVPLLQGVDVVHATTVEKMMGATTCTASDSEESALPGASQPGSVSPVPSLPTPSEAAVSGASKLCYVGICV